jgi:hypothetical protein
MLLSLNARYSCQIGHTLADTQDLIPPAPQAIISKPNENISKLFSNNAKVKCPKQYKTDT